MFEIAKLPYKLQVRLDGKTVKVKLLTPLQCRGLVERTVARCEEFLAQVSLQDSKAKASLALLMLHFTSRGWEVIA